MRSTCSWRSLRVFSAYRLQSLIGHILLAALEAVKKASLQRLSASVADRTPRLVHYWHPGKDASSAPIGFSR